MIDFAAIARAAFDRPLAADERAALRVWADQLESAGDPRGGLIAIEHGEGPLWDRPYRRTLAMAEHLLGDDADGADDAHPVLGAFARVLAVPRAAALDWRGGALYAATLDTRHTAKLWKVPPVELVARLVAMPVVSTLRRLVVRVRVARDVPIVVAALREASARLPDLEQLSVLAMPVPVQVTTPAPYAWDELRAEFPRLWLAAFDRAWWRAPADGEALFAGDDPADAAARIRIGRALFVTPDPIRGGPVPAVPSAHVVAAIERLCVLGPRALPYRELLEMLVMHGWRAHVPIGLVVRAAGALGIEGVPLRRRIVRCGYPGAEVKAAIAAIDRAIAARDVPDSNRRDPP